MRHCVETGAAKYADLKDSISNTNEFVYDGVPSYALVDTSVLRRLPKRGYSTGDHGPARFEASDVNYGTAGAVRKAVTAIASVAQQLLQGVYGP